MPRAATAFLEGRVGSGAIWFAGVLLVFAIAGLVENVKATAVNQSVTPMWMLEGPRDVVVLRFITLGAALVAGLMLGAALVF